MAVMASDGPSPHSPSLHLGLTVPQPSRRRHAQSLLGPSWPKNASCSRIPSQASCTSLPPRRWATTWHAVGSHSALALRLYLVACNPSVRCRFWVLDHLWSNLSQSFHPIPLPCALAFPPSSHRDATTPCWAPHVMTQERIMFSNPTPSTPHLSPAATMSDDTPLALTPSLHCASILQTISAPICFNCFTLSESQKPDLWTCVCVLPFPLLPLLFW